MFSTPVSATQGTSKISPSWVRASPSRYTEMPSEASTTTAPTGRRSRKNPFRQVDSVWAAPRPLPRARCWAVRLEAAAVSPTAVRDRITENTGMTSWYRPMTSAPTIRDRATR